MAKRRGRRQARREPPAVVEYADADGNVLRLRQSLSPGTVSKIREVSASGAASIDDARARREELLFERLAVGWDIAGMPITKQSMLLARLRMANSEELAWVRRTLVRHVGEHLPELDGR